MKRILLSLLLLVTVTGCNLIPEYKQPSVALPQTWKDARKPDEAPINADWWVNFKSKELNALMDEALANNLDLRASLARVEQSRAVARIAGASLLPSVDADSSLGGTRRNPSTGASTWRPSADAGLSVSYELDLFGANRAGVKSAKADWRSSIYGHDALRLLVMSDVAKGYFRLLNLKERLGISQRSQNNIEQVLKVAQARFDAGSTSAIDVSRQKTELANARASVAALRNQVNAAENALAILLGKAPQNLGIKSSGLGGVASPKVPAKQPSSIIAQRPDIRASEWSLIAANADIGVARAAFFPVVDLGSTAALAFSPLTAPAATTLSVLASAAMPLFKGGSLEGGVERATARQVELAEVYRLGILTSLQEAEDAMSSVRAAQSRQGNFAEAVKEAKKTYELSRGLYEAGSVDYQTMLEAERTLLAANDNYASVKLELLGAEVDLYRALGGGWTAK